jgi:hypothetical protein
MAATAAIISFAGSVQCHREPGVPRLTLSGVTADAWAEPASVAFPLNAPEDLPAQLSDVAIDRLAAGAGFRISSGQRSWLLSGDVCFVHREVAGPFYAAIVPRAVPWGKRMFLHLVLRLMGNPLGRRLLLALRR